MADFHLVASPLHESSEIMIHVVEDHVYAALHVVDLMSCNKDTSGVFACKSSLSMQIACTRYMLPTIKDRHM